MTKIIEKSKEKIGFIIETSETLANAIRRSVNEIPVLAIESIEFHKNDSALYDEMIAHRIGLIPLKEGRKLTEVEKCSCEGKGCNKCEIKLSLKSKGPSIVYSGDLKGDVEVIYEKMPIVILEKDQQLELVAMAKLGKAVNHAKYSSGLVYYRNISEITVKDAAECEKVIEKLGNSVLNPPKSKVKNGETFKCTQDMDYIESLAKTEDAIEVKPGEEIVFFIESWGQIKPEEIFIEAVKALNKNLKEVSKVMDK